VDWNYRLTPRRSLATFLNIQRVVGDRFGIIHCDYEHCIFIVLKGGEGVFCMEKMRERDWDYRLEGLEGSDSFKGEIVGGVMEKWVVDVLLRLW